MMLFRIRMVGWDSVVAAESDVGPLNPLLALDIEMYRGQGNSGHWLDVRTVHRIPMSVSAKSPFPGHFIEPHNHTCGHGPIMRATRPRPPGDNVAFVPGRWSHEAENSITSLSPIVCTRVPSSTHASVNL